MTRRACKIIDLTNFKIYPSMASLAEELNVTSGGEI